MRSPPKRSAREFLDTPGQDPVALARLLNDIRRTNRWFGGYPLVLTYLRRVVRVLSHRPITLLDVATAGADVPRAIAAWARRQQIPLRIVALDLSEEILAQARRRTDAYPEITLLRGNALALPFPDRAVDVVICGLALHHFPYDEAGRAGSGRSAGTRNCVPTGMSFDADIIVVGAGPAGSTVAMLLAAGGVQVRVLDRATFPRDKPCGDYCNPGAVGLLRDLGMLPAVLDAGAAVISAMRVYAQDGSRFEAPFPVGDGLLLPRLRLDAALLGHASRAGAAIEEGVAVESVRIHPDAVDVQMASGRRLRARLLIAADGMHSTIARRLGRLRVPAAARYTVGAYFSSLSRTTPGGELHLGSGLYAGVAHFGGGVANVCMALPRRLWRRAGPQPTFEAALTCLPALAEAMAGARRESAFRCCGPVGFAVRDPVADRVLLIGDAGGQIEPMTGQGIFLALHSASLAAGVALEVVHTGDLSHRRLATYAQRRRLEIAGKLAVSRWLQRLALHPRITPLLVGRLRAHPSLAGDLLGATGDVLRPGSVLSPAYLARLFT